jgi:hypothetical protein
MELNKKHFFSADTAIAKKNLADKNKNSIINF